MFVSMLYYIANIGPPLYFQKAFYFIEGIIISYKLYYKYYHPKSLQDTL